MEAIETQKTKSDINKESTPERFVAGIAKRCNLGNKGFAAKLKRADNPATEYQCWDILAQFNIQLDNPHKRLPYVTIAAAIAKSKAKENGKKRFGKAIADCYDDGRDSSPAIARLRRLLACDDMFEVCEILRPIFSLIASKGGKTLDFVRLLKQLKSFPFDPQDIKSQWAQEFYWLPAKADKEGDAGKGTKKEETKQS